MIRLAGSLADKFSDKASPVEPSPPQRTFPTPTMRAARTIYPAGPPTHGSPAWPSEDGQGVSPQEGRDHELRLIQATAQAESGGEASLGSQISAQIVPTPPSDSPSPTVQAAAPGLDGAVSPPLTPDLPCGTLTDFASR